MNEVVFDTAAGAGGVGMWLIHAGALAGALGSSMKGWVCKRRS